MKIVSWNVAGLRACLNKGFDRFFELENADIYCLQETKVLEEQNPFHPYGYNEYLFPAEKKGYSGTMVYSKVEPLSVKYGIDDFEYDSEGRTITLEFDDFYLVTCYVPNSKRELIRLDSRMRFEDLMRNYLNSLREKKNVIYCGDLNVSHQEIDIKNPDSNRRNAGFTDEERGKMTELLDSGFVDTFRYLYPTEVKYSWWSYMRNARRVVDSKILSDIEGSDHCPIELEI